MRRFAVLLFILLTGWSWVHAQILTDSNLPIVVITTDGGVNIPDEPKVLGTMKIIWHQDGSRNALSDINDPACLNYDGRIGIEVRGSSSQMLQKKQYGFTTLQADNVTNNNVSLLGMPEENDWVLSGLAYDQTGMRDALSYELSESLGQYAPRWVYCEVMLNGDYRGLYVLIEKIKVDKNRVNIEKMDETCNNYPEVTGGYIVQTDRSSTGDLAWTMPTYQNNGWWGYVNAEFVYGYPKYEDITTAQANYIHNEFTTLASMANGHDIGVATGIPSLIDIPSFIDFMIMGEFSSNVDVYQLSTFFHKDRLGKLRAGPIWDYNLAYGHDEFGSRSRYDVWQFDNNDNLGPRFWRDLFQTDLFRCYFAKRWFEVTQPGQPLDYERICDRIDEIDAWIAEGVDRDNQRWHKMTSHTYYVSEMKSWLTQRINWLNHNIGSCEACDEVEVPPLVISKIHYHPEDWWGINGDRLEFIQIDNNGDLPVDLTGIYLRELGITYSFPEGAVLAAHDSLVLCSDSVAFVQYYNMTPFDQYARKLSNKSENLVLVDAWGNLIDQVHYYDSDPWPWEADGEGPYLQLIDLNFDNSLPESWTVGYDITGVSENVTAEGFRVFPNPAHDMITVVLSNAVETRRGTSLQEYRITNLMGQTLMSGTSLRATREAGARQPEGSSTEGRKSNLTIDVSKLPAGIYFITIGDKTQKLVIR